MFAFVFAFMAIASLTVNWSYVQPEDYETDEPRPSITGLEQPRPVRTPTPTPLEQTTI